MQHWLPRIESLQKVDPGKPDVSQTPLNFPGAHTPASGHSMPYTRCMHTPCPTVEWIICHSLCVASNIHCHRQYPARVHSRATVHHSLSNWDAHAVRTQIPAYSICMRGVEVPVGQTFYLCQLRSLLDPLMLDPLMLDPLMLRSLLDKLFTFAS